MSNITKGKVLAVCDTDAAFAYNLSEYINRKRNSYFFAHAFSNADSIIDFAKKNFIDVLLLSDSIASQVAEHVKSGLTLILSKGEVVSKKLEYPSIYKFQAASEIIKEVMNEYSNISREETRVINKKTSVIGVYSPVRRVLKTSFALTLGQLMAKERPCLYINLEDYSGFSELFGKEYKGDLSDVIYYLRQKNVNFMAKLESVMDTIGNLDYIPPVLSPMDIREVKVHEWERLLNEIIDKTIYEEIVVDFGDGVDGLIDLLDLCDKVYMPVKEDYLSDSKIKQFENLVYISNKHELSNHIQKVKLPYHNTFGTKENYAEQLIWSELGDYVRELIR